jgi:hypothetical protein
MKYKTAKVIGHPRAGTHYLAKLLNMNFFHEDDYLKLYAGHSYAHVSNLKNRHTAVFYIYRGEADTLRSMWKLRNRFGLVAKNLKEFVTTPCNEMHNVKINSSAIFNNGKSKTEVTQVDSYFANIKLTLPEYLNEHKKYWLAIDNSNFMPVYYDHLIDSFEFEMNDIARFLRSEKTEFIRETSRIGWYDKNEAEKNLS